MKVEQKIVTMIVAEEGKLLKRKSDGMIAGERLTLGYNYYEAGVALSSPQLETPNDYEEIDKPLDYDTTPVVDHVKRLKRAKELLAQNTKEMNSLGLKAKEALEVAEWYPEFGSEGVAEGDEMRRGNKFRHKDKLWVVLQKHTIKPLYKPEDAPNLYEELTEDYEEPLMGEDDEPLIDDTRPSEMYGNKEQ